MTGSFNAVTAPSVMAVESLVQVTVVAGPPVVIHVRVNSRNFPLVSKKEVNTRFPFTLTSPMGTSCVFKEKELCHTSTGIHSLIDCLPH